MRRRIKLPQPAMLVSIIALFVALSGTGTAAVVLSGKSVTGKTGAGVARKAKKKSKSKRTTRFVAGPKGQQGDGGPQGVQGLQGPAGADGPPGPQGEKADPGPTALRFAARINATGSPDKFYVSDDIPIVRRKSTGTYTLEFSQDKPALVSAQATPAIGGASAMQATVNGYVVTLVAKPLQDTDFNVEVIGQPGG